MTVWYQRIEARSTGTHGNVPALLSIVIPTLNAEPDLAQTLACVAQAGQPTEVIVADGGSADQTAEIAAEAGARVVVAQGGRGPQLIAGAAAAIGDRLLFLHADTRPQPGWGHAVRAFMKDDANRFRAGYFRFALNDPAPQARRVETLVEWRCRLFGLPYGDQGLLIGREFYDFLGGFAPIPLMEDVEIARRIGLRRLVRLPVAAVTSAARYRRDGYWLRPVRNLVCVGLYFLGMPPRHIRALYE
jgi:rSAM/selenodomain-associated transferase 2